MSRHGYLVGIDGGSQSTKVVVHDLAGRLVCEGRQPLRPMHMPAPGVVEHPDDDLWDSLAVAARQAMERFPGDPADILGVGLCTIRFCRALLRADGSLAAPVLSWMDARVSQPYRQVDPAVRYVTTSSGYVSHRLTGELRDTAANYKGQWPIDTDTWAWDEAALAASAAGGDGPTREQLFELVMPGEPLGTVTAAAAAATGLPAGLPVVATANDKAVEALGCGIVDGDAALVSLGTYIAGMVLGRSNPALSEHYWTNFACQPYRYLHESHGIRRGMWTVSWLRDLLGEEVAHRAAAAGSGVEEYMDAAAAQVPAGSDGLMTVLDWLAPTEAPHRKGVMLGFDQRHGWPHLYRSVLEGIALTMTDRLGAMCAELEHPLTRVVLSGGGSASRTTMQIFADAMDLPTVRPAASSAAGLGAALCAAVGVGAFPDVAAAAAAMVRLGDVFEPDPAAVGLYRELLDIHRSIPRYTDHVLARTYPIFH